MRDFLLTKPREGKWNGIDLFKLLMAFCVVAIHTKPLYDYTGPMGFLVERTVRCAVPFFFLASGFLLAAKMKTPYDQPNNIPVLRAFLKRIGKLYLLWTCVYIPLSVLHAYQMREGAWKFLLDFVRRFFLIGEQYNAFHLWYLLATLYAAGLILLLMRKRAPFAVTVCICLALYAVSLFFDWLRMPNDSLPPVLLTAQKVLENSFANGKVLRGFLYFPIGMILARAVLRPWISAVLFVISFGISYFSAGQVGDFAAILSVIALFCIAQSLPLRDSAFYPFARKVSTWVYLLHVFVWVVFNLICYGREEAYGIVPFSVTSVVSVLLAILFVWIFDYKRVKKETDHQP